MNWAENIKTIKQPVGSKDCLACVAAMITSTTPEEYKRFCRENNLCLHDDVSLCVYVRIYGFIMGISPDTDEHFRRDSVIGIFTGPCYVVVQSASKAIREAGATHAIFWDGRKVHDPAPGFDDINIRKYKTKMIFPITQISDEIDCACGCNSVNKRNRKEKKQ